MWAHPFKLFPEKNVKPIKSYHETKLLKRVVVYVVCGNGAYGAITGAGGSVVLCVLRAYGYGADSM